MTLQCVFNFKNLLWYCQWNLFVSDSVAGQDNCSVQLGWADQWGQTPGLIVINGVHDKRGKYAFQVCSRWQIYGTVEQGYASSRTPDVSLPPLPAWLITVVLDRADQCVARERKHTNTHYRFKWLHTCLLSTYSERKKIKLNEKACTVVGVDLC